MEKLLELLNQFENTDNWENGHQVEFRESKIISKKFGFIKRLVDNDKIDFDKLSKKEIESRVSIVMRGVFIETNWLLMLLAIQDDPISFLISVLK